MDELELRRSVRARYGAGEEACCAGEAGGCGGSDLFPLASLVSPDLGTIPKLGVGDPLAILSPRPGETILDLGSGPGRDALRAAELVGPEGRVIGVDATPEMVYRAREAAKALRRPNVEFRLGEIEHLPLESGSVDGIVSDCVINLSTDKPQVFREAFRVLRSGGRLVVSDVVADQDLPDEVRSDPQRWAACEAGAVPEATYLSLLREVGFVDLHSESTGAYKAGLSKAVVLARKPSSSG